MWSSSARPRPRQFFPGEDPIGRQVQVDLSNSGASPDSPDRVREIVGVVGDIRHRPRRDSQPVVYVPYEQHPWNWVANVAAIHFNKRFVIRTAANPMGLAAAVQDIVAAADPDQVVERLMPMRQRLSDSATPERFWLQLLGLFAALAVFLAAIRPLRRHLVWRDAGGPMSLASGPPWARSGRTSSRWSWVRGSSSA